MCLAPRYLKWPPTFSITFLATLSPVHLRVDLSDWVPELVSLQLKFSSQNSANQMFRRLFSRERVMKYWSNPEREGEKGGNHSQP